MNPLALVALFLAAGPNHGDSPDKDKAPTESAAGGQLPDAAETTTVTGTIAKVSIVDISKTSRVKKPVLYLYLKSPEFPDKILRFRKYPVLDADDSLKEGQRVAVTTWKSCVKKQESISIASIELL